ncbi:unnamed protein product [Strongylus vulgaris]|uniref:Uncharacterized protein n=1 Tax=Strongylus vulgaris TaxID=40348 RepID=A0A3P7L730_STRVU|nr:unnamed protein product [Strongylus vulgaris]
MTAYGHSAGESIECLSIAIELKKEETVDQFGNIVYKVGFKIGGGIDQDPSCAPYKYPDQVYYTLRMYLLGCRKSLCGFFQS